MKGFLKILFIFVLLVFTHSISKSNGNEIKSVVHTIAFDTNNTAKVQIYVDLGDYEKDTIYLPAAFKSIEDLNIFDSISFKIDIVFQNDLRYFRIIKKSNSKEKCFSIIFSDNKFFNFKDSKVSDFGNYTLNYKFVNTSNCKILTFSACILLPSKFTVTSIEESYPKLSNNNPDPPYEIIHLENRNGIEIRNSRMNLADYCSIKFRFKNDEKSDILLFAIIFIGVFYLIYFRDLLKKQNNN